MVDLKETVEFIENKINGEKVEIAIILGSGLGEIADEHCEKYINYSEIPGFCVSTVKGHKGRLVFAKINEKNVMMMQGRFHFYEGHSMDVVTYPIKVMKKLGIKKLILTNAAGGVNKSFRYPELMIIEDHINMMGKNPLMGKNDDTLGERFPDMSEVYKKDLIKIAENCANELDIELKKGVYLANTGPSYETPAEIRMARTLGADAIGMSTVPEAIVANYCGIDVLGISCITNAAAGVLDEKLCHNDVINAANEIKDRFKTLILKIIKNV